MAQMTAEVGKVLVNRGELQRLRRDEAGLNALCELEGEVMPFEADDPFPKFELILPEWIPADCETLYDVVEALLAHFC